MDLVEDDNVELGRRIDVPNSQLDQRYPSMTEIAKLAQAGLNLGEIGRIVGKPTNYVTATLSQGKKRGRNGNRRQFRWGHTRYDLWPTGKTE